VVDNLGPPLRVVVCCYNLDAPCVLLYYYLVLALEDLLNYRFSNSLLVMHLRDDNILKAFSCNLARVGLVSELPMGLHESAKLHCGS